MIDECVAMAPGYTHTTEMPCGAPSAASAWVSPVSPNLLAQYADAPAAPLGRPAPDIVLTAANTEQVIGHVAAGPADIGFTEGPRRPAGPQGHRPGPAGRGRRSRPP